MSAECLHGGKLLVAVEAEGKIIRRVLGDRRSDTVEALEVGVGVTADLDFEMPQSVRPDALVERLWQRVVQLFPGRYLLAGQRVGQADRVARQHLGQRLFRQQFGRGALGQGVVDRSRLEAQRPVAQRLPKRPACCSADRLNQRPLRQRGAKVR